MSNPAMPGIVKIGFSTKDPALRAREFDGSGLPYPYVVEYDVLVENPREVEQRAHKYLSKCREKKEWFRCSAREAIVAIKNDLHIILMENYRTADLEEESQEWGRSEEPEALTRSRQAENAPRLNNIEKSRPVEAVRITSVKIEPRRSTGTYVGTCSYCGNNFSATLYPRDTKARCPECLRINDATEFMPQEFLL